MLELHQCRYRPSSWGLGIESRTNPPTSLSHSPHILAIKSSSCPFLLYLPPSPLSICLLCFHFSYLCLGPTATLPLPLSACLRQESSAAFRDGISGSTQNEAKIHEPSSFGAGTSASQSPLAGTRQLTHHPRDISNLSQDYFSRRPGDLSFTIFFFVLSSPSRTRLTLPSRHPHRVTGAKTSHITPRLAAEQIWTLREPVLSKVPYCSRRSLATGRHLSSTRNILGVPGHSKRLLPPPPPLVEPYR